MNEYKVFAQGDSYTLHAHNVEIDDNRLVFYDDDTEEVVACFFNPTGYFLEKKG